MPAIKLHHIGVVVGPQKPEANAAVANLVKWCEQQKILVSSSPEIAAQFSCQSFQLQQDQLTEPLDLLVVMGGDGTMLGASRLIGDLKIPVLGINFGYLGYLTEFTNDLFVALEGLQSGALQVESRMMLEVSVERDGKIIASHRALNEAVVNQGALARMIELECFVNGDFVNNFRADGMIVSTPTGSTAYSLSAGGPIVFPSMDAIVLTPICPHTLSNRPVIIPGDLSVSLTFKKANDVVMLTIDGQRGVTLEANDKVIMQRSDATFDLVRPVQRNYFEVLRTKLKWGSL
jgi:NAD+ kinase